jgi:hypothetical protein
MRHGKQVGGSLNSEGMAHGASTERAAAESTPPYRANQLTTMPGARASVVFTLVRPSDVAPGYLTWSGVPLLVFHRRSDGSVVVEDFPVETEVCEVLLPRIDSHVVRLERGRLYVTAANGEAVYVPVGPSPRPTCMRYGRLYLRRFG